MELYLVYITNMNMIALYARIVRARDYANGKKYVFFSVVAARSSESRIADHFPQRI